MAQAEAENVPDAIAGHNHSPPACLIATLSTCPAG